jgi:hypothetical protein
VVVFSESVSLFGKELEVGEDPVRSIGLVADPWISWITAAVSTGTE